MTRFLYLRRNKMHFCSLISSTLDTLTYVLPWRKRWIINYLSWMFSFTTIHQVHLLPRSFAKRHSLVFLLITFTALSYKIGLGRTLIDRTFKINNTWSGFHNDVRHLTFILRKNLFPTHLIDKVLNRYITRPRPPQLIVAKFNPLSQ